MNSFLEQEPTRESINDVNRHFPLNTALFPQIYGIHPMYFFKYHWYLEIKDGKLFASE
jgi:hypothetical protein